MTWNVRAILKICDSFTGRPASLSHLRVTADAGLMAIRKPEGLLVFVENHNYRAMERARILLESPVFQKREITLSLAEPPRVTVVWMVPSETYPEAPGSARLYGSAPGGARLSFVFTEHAGSMKLLSDYSSPGDALIIYHPGILSLEGYTLEFEYSGRREQAAIGRKLEITGPDTGSYLAEDLVPGHYPKMDTIVRRVYHAAATEKGMYAFLFRSLPAPEAKGRLELKAEGVRREACASLREGRSVRLDWPD